MKLLLRWLISESRPMLRSPFTKSRMSYQCTHVSSQNWSLLIRTRRATDVIQGHISSSASGLGAVFRDSFLTNSAILHICRTHTAHDPHLTFACGSFRGSSLGDRPTVGRCFRFTTSEAGCSPLSALAGLVRWENVELVAAGGGFLGGERAIGDRRDLFRQTSRCSLNTLNTTCSRLGCR
jgi:hypothetical protein